MTDSRSLLSLPPFSERLAICAAKDAAAYFRFQDAIFCRSEDLGAYKKIKELGGAGEKTVCYECPKTAFNSPLIVPFDKKKIAAIMPGENVRHLSKSIKSGDNELIALLTDYDLSSVFAERDVELGVFGKTITSRRLPEKVFVALDMPHSTKRGLFADAFCSAASAIIALAELRLGALIGFGADKELDERLCDIISRLISAKVGEETDAVFHAQALYAKLVYDRPEVFCGDARVAAKILKKSGVSASLAECEYSAAKALLKIYSIVCESLSANNVLFPKTCERLDRLTALFGAEEDAFTKDFRVFDEPAVYKAMSALCGGASAKKICRDLSERVAMLDGVYARIYGGRKKRATVSERTMAQAIGACGLLSEGVLKFLSDGGVLDLL